MISKQDIYETCQKAVADAGLLNFAPLTDDQLRTSYATFATWRDCMDTHGYHVGPIVSEDAFVAAQGNILVIPGYSDALYGASRAALEQLDVDCPRP